MSLLDDQFSEIMDLNPELIRHVFSFKVTADVLSKVAAAKDMEYVLDVMPEHGMFGFYANHHVRQASGIAAIDVMKGVTYLERFPLQKKMPLDIVDLNSLEACLISDAGWQNASVLVVVTEPKQEYITHVTALCMSPLPILAFEKFSEISRTLLWIDREVTYCPNSRMIQKGFPGVVAMNHLSTLHYLGRGPYSLDMR